MNELQAKLLEMLKEIDEICKKHHITYYLVGGSALGAVRHRGFIPWDDDADIVMTRENWYKFESVIDQEIRSDRRYMTWRRTEDYPAVFARYSNVNATCIVNSLSYSPIDWGIMIDIFVLTPLPNEEKKRKKFHDYMKIYGEIVNPFFPVNQNTSYFQYRFWKFAAKLFGKERVLNFINRKIYGYNEDSCTHYSYGYPRVHVIYDKSIFREPKYLPFEDAVLPVPTKVEEHLRILFGETWALLPEKDNQKSEHNMTVDLRRTYGYYRDDYLQNCDIHRLMKAYGRWKNWRIRVQNKNNYRKQALVTFHYLKDFLEWSNFWTDSLEQIRRLYAGTRYSELSVLLQPFYPLFSKSDYLNNNLGFMETDEQLEIIFYMLNHDGLYHVVLELGQALLKTGKKFGCQSKKIFELAELKHHVCIMLERGEDSEAECTLKTQLEIFPEDYTLLLFSLQIFFRRRPVNLPEVKRIVELGLMLFPHDGAFHKFHGDYLLIIGDRTEAVREYMLAKENLRNGFLLLEIEDYFKRETTVYE